MFLNAAKDLGSRGRGELAGQSSLDFLRVLGFVLATTPARAVVIARWQAREAPDLLERTCCPESRGLVVRS